MFLCACIRAGFGKLAHAYVYLGVTARSRAPCARAHMCTFLLDFRTLILDAGTACWPLHNPTHNLCLRRSVTILHIPVHIWQWPHFQAVLLRRDPVCSCSRTGPYRRKTSDHIFAFSGSKPGQACTRLDFDFDFSDVQNSASAHRKVGPSLPTFLVQKRHSLGSPGQQPPSTHKYHHGSRLPSSSSASKSRSVDRQVCHPQSKPQQRLRTAIQAGGGAAQHHDQVQYEQVSRQSSLPLLHRFEDRKVSHFRSYFF